MDNFDSKPASINDFEQAVLSRNYEQAEHLIVQLIKLYGKEKISLTLAPFDRQLTQEQADLESYQVLEKLAYTLTIWFSDPNWQPNTNIYRYLAMQKQFINSVFLASSYHSTDHILNNLNLLGKANYTTEEVKRILLVITTESDIELPWSDLLVHMPDETAQAFIGLVSSIGIQVSKRAQKNISAILGSVQSLPTVDTNNIKNLGPLLKAFFNCSNLPQENKYNLKKWIVKSIEQYTENNTAVRLKKKLKNDVKKKPFLKQQTILFVNEQYKSFHAMYRSWHDLVKQVNNKYNTVSISLKEALDHKSSQDFDKVITFDDSWDIENIAEKIIAIRPDVIIYPSIGMSTFAPFLATMRLAPIQIALPGHPSSSYISNVDFFFTSREGMTDDEMSNILTEKWLSCDDGPGQVSILNKNTLFKKREENVFRILVNGVIQKVSHHLIETCLRISKQAQKPVEFVFFMAHPKQDVEYFAAKSALRRFLPNSVLHPFKDYNTYMECLAGCKLAIPTFPFGGSNSNVDLIRVGVPKLFIRDTSDLSGVSDLQIWKEVGETFGYCKSIKELEQRAVELIDNPTLLAQFEEKTRAINIESIDTSYVSGKPDNRLVNAITQTIENY